MSFEGYFRLWCYEAANPHIFLKVFLLENCLIGWKWSSKWSFDLNLSLTDITVVRYVPRQNPFFSLWEIIIKSYFLIYHSIYNFLFFSFFFLEKIPGEFSFQSQRILRKKKKMEKNVDLFHTWKYIFLSITIFFFPNHNLKKILW